MPNSTDDFSSNSLTSGSITVGSSRSGVIETAFDIDWFRIDLVTGHTYRINLDAIGMYSATVIGQPAPPPPSLDTFLRGIYDVNGVLISNTSNDDFNGRNAQVTFTPTTSGTYFIAAGAYGQTTGDYNLSVTAQESLPTPVVTDDFAATTSTIGVVAVNSVASGRIETAQDNDWFRIELNAGQTYRINLDAVGMVAATVVGQPPPPPPSLDTFLRGIYDVNGVLISNTSNDDFNGRNAQVTFTPTTSATYFIAAGAYGQTTGAYNLLVTAQDSLPTPTPTPTSGDDYVNNVASSTTVAVGSSITGVIETARDSDWFRVVLNEGQTYRINMAGNGNSALSDSVIRGVYTADGVYVNGTMNDDYNGWNGDSQVTFIATRSGVYYIAAEGFGNHVGGYRLSLADISPPNSADDFSNDISTTGRVTLNAASTGVLQHAADIDWFSAELEAGLHYRFEMPSNRYWSAPTYSDGRVHILWVEPGSAGYLPSPFTMEVHSNNGAPIAGAVSHVDVQTLSDSPSSSFLDFTPSSSGTYFIAVSADGSYQGNYSVVMRTLPAAQDLLSNNDVDVLLGAGGTNLVPTSGVVADSVGQRMISLADQMNVAMVV